MKTVYKSEILDKTFETEEECLNAEKEHEEKLALEKAKKAERKERAEEVEEAFKAADEAYKHAKELLSNFCKDYGVYHKSYTGDDVPTTRSIFDMFFNDKFFLF